MSEWLDIKQYPGFAILSDASKIRTADGVEHFLIPGKLFYYTNPNSGGKNFATPETLLKRALKGTEKKEKKVYRSEPSKPIEQRFPPRVKITLTGKEALLKAIETGCDLYYNTPRWGWWKSIRNPAEMIALVEADLAADREVRFPYTCWGITEV